MIASAKSPCKEADDTAEMFEYRQALPLLLRCASGWRQGCELGCKEKLAQKFS